MLKQIIRPLYHFSHDLLFQTRQFNPLIKQKHAGYPILQGHISDEHLADAALEDILAKGLREKGVSVKDFEIDIPGYYQYLERAQYPATYYGGGLDPEQNFTEKTLEHYVSLSFLNLQTDATFVDVAACTSPFFQILRRLYGLTETYNQDLIFEPGLHGDRIGGYAHELHLPDESVDGVTLHCSLEHFEDDTDTRFFQELERVLKPGGRAVILPFYLAHEYTIHVDPAYNLLKNHKP
ncbi:MAG: class I SAM-dependent methyltransferase, partial [Bacteroidota bacterium]